MTDKTVQRPSDPKVCGHDVERLRNLGWYHCPNCGEYIGDHRGISRGGQHCTDNDCRCHGYPLVKRQEHIPSKTVDNPWREFIENVISGKNYFRVSEYHELLADLDRLYALEEERAPKTAVVHMGIDDQPHDGRRVDCAKCHSDELSDGAHGDWLTGAQGLVDACAERRAPETRAFQPGLAGQIERAKQQIEAWPTDVRMAMGLPLKANERPACTNVPALIAHNNAAVDLAHSRLIQINELRSRIDRAIYCLERGWSAAARDALGPVGAVHAEVAASINAAIDSMT